jgi:hypothetical protein
LGILLFLLFLVDNPDSDLPEPPGIIVVIDFKSEACEKRNKFNILFKISYQSFRFNQNQKLKF